MEMGASKCKKFLVFLKKLIVNKLLYILTTSDFHKVLTVLVELI
jgi:hypothetical protein